MVIFLGERASKQPGMGVFLGDKRTWICLALLGDWSLKGLSAPAGLHPPGDPTGDPLSLDTPLMLGLIPGRLGVFPELLKSCLCGVPLGEAAGDLRQRVAKGDVINREDWPVATPKGKRESSIKDDISMIE